MVCSKIISKSYLLQWFQTSLHKPIYPTGHALAGQEYFQQRTKSKATAEKVFEDFLNEKFGKDSWKEFTDDQLSGFVKSLKAKIDSFPKEQPTGFAARLLSAVKTTLWLDQDAKHMLTSAIDAGIGVFLESKLPDGPSQQLLSVDTRTFYYTDNDVKEMVYKVTEGPVRKQEHYAIRALLKKTYTGYNPESNGDPECITCENVSLKLGSQINDLKIPANSKIEVNHEPNFYQYNQNGQYWVDFAHAGVFGGAWNTYGCVQEERMFAEFPLLGLLDHLSKGNVHPCLHAKQSNVKGPQQFSYPPDAEPAPFIIYGVKRRYNIEKTPYGTKIHEVKEQDVATKILGQAREVTSDEKKSVNIIGLAAVDFRGTDRGYILEDLEYHFKASYLAYARAKEVNPNAVIHTGAWGCGAFLNNIKMMIALQYLAARAAGVNITFHRSENTKDSLEKDAISHVDSLLNQGMSIQDVLKNLLALTTDELDPWQRRGLNSYM